MYDLNYFSNTLKNIISSKGINQRWLAEECGTTEATISRYITGYRQPKIEVVIEIARVLGVSVDHLFGLDAPATKKPDSDIRVLVSCYKHSTADDRKVLWAVLDKYMTEEDRLLINAHEKIEKSDAV